MLRHIKMLSRMPLIWAFLALMVTQVDHAETRSGPLGRSAARQASDPARPDEARDSALSWQMVGQVGGPTQAIAVQDDYAYVGIGLRLVVLDVSNPITPTELGATTPFPHFVEGVVVSGTLAYVAAGGAGLQVVDISDPAHPAEVGGWDSLGYASGVAMAGNTAYLADGPYGLRLLDVSDPTHPTEIGSVYDMNYAFDIAVDSSCAYIAAAGAGLLVADISDPAHPVEMGTLDTPGYAYGVTGAGDAVLVADGWEGIRLVDASNPATPTEVSAYKTPGWAFDVVVSGGLAYVADAFKGLQLVDISNPVHPVGVGGFEVVAGHAGGIAVAGSVAYVADRNWGLRTVSVSDPSRPAQIGFYGPPSYADGVTVAGNYAYVAAAGYGLRVVDVSDPTQPVQVGIYDTQSYATSVAKAGDYAYVATMPGPTGEMHGLHVVDVSDAAQPDLAGYIDSYTGAYRDLAVAGEIAYIADEWGLELVSVSDPFDPAYLGFVELWEWCGATDAAVGVAVSGTLAYVASGSAGLEIVDVSSPISPTLIGAYYSGPSCGCWDAAVAGSIAYMADGAGLQVVDVSDPYNPIGIGLCYLPQSRSVVVSEDLAYVAGGSEGVFAVDVSDPYSPTLAMAFDTAGFANEVAVAGDHVYVADGINGLLILEKVDGGQGGSPTMAFATDQLVSAWDKDPPQAVTSRWGLPVFQSAFREAVRPDQMNPDSTLASRESVEKDVQATDEPARIASSCVVTSTFDSGAGTLRWCLENAESDTTITFEPSVFPPTPPVSIALESPLPIILQGNITIDGSNAGVILDGSNVPDGDGLEIMSDGNVIMGLQILNFPGAGLSIDCCKNNIIGGDRTLGAGPVGRGNVISGNGFYGVNIGSTGTMSNTVLGNLIGTNVSGTDVLGNGGNGVFICCGASNNQIGGTNPEHRNILSGNNTGISIFRGAHSNLIIGNYVGTDLYGTRALGNANWGISMELGGVNNRIEGNLVSGNGGTGIYVGDWGSDYNVLVANLIGTDISGTQVISNGGGVGIGSPSGGSFNRVGGTHPQDRNVVSGNNGAGINVGGAASMGNLVLGNFVGTDVTGRQALGNTEDGIGLGGGGRTLVGGTTPAERNVICGNGRDGIELVHQSYSCIMGNYIGTDVSGEFPLGNQWIGIGVGTGGYRAEHNVIQGNLVAHTSFSLSEPDRGGVGIRIDTYSYNTIRRNSIYGNAGKGIETTNGGNEMLPAPVIITVTQMGTLGTAGIEASVSGTAYPGCTVEVFSDEEDEGRVYEGDTIADDHGNWRWTGNLNGPFVTATATDQAGNTSPFSAPQMAWWHQVYLPIVLRGED